MARLSEISLNLTYSPKNEFRSPRCEMLFTKTKTIPVCPVCSQWLFSWCWNLFLVRLYLHLRFFRVCVWFKSSLLIQRGTEKCTESFNLKRTKNTGRLLSLLRSLTETLSMKSFNWDRLLRPFGRPEGCVLFLIVRLVKVYENSSAAEFFEKFVDASIVRW